MISKSNETGGFGLTDLKLGGKIYGFTAAHKDYWSQFDVKTPVAEIPWVGMDSDSGSNVGVDYIVEAIMEN